jgi:outer membrane protein
MRWPRTAGGRGAAGRRWSPALLGLSVLAVASGLRAQVPAGAGGPDRAGAVAAAPRLTLDDALGAALATHPALAAAEAGVERADAGRSDAFSAWLPSLSLDAGLTRYENPMVVAPLHGLDFANPPHFDNLLAQGGLSLGWTVFDAGRGARYGRAQALEGVARAGARSAEQQVLADVARAYLRVGSTREVLDAHDRGVAALQGERDRAAQVLQQGRAARVTLLRAEAALAQAQADREAARMDAELAERDLARLMGVPPERVAGAPLQAVRLVADTLPSRAEALDLAQQASPELESVRGQAQAARAGRSESRALWLPRVQLLARLSQYGSNQYSPTHEWQGGVQVSYPLFTGGARMAAGERAG